MVLCRQNKVIILQIIISEPASIVKGLLKFTHICKKFTVVKINDIIKGVDIL